MMSQISAYSHTLFECCFVGWNKTDIQVVIALVGYVIFIFNIVLIGYQRESNLMGSKQEWDIIAIWSNCILDADAKEFAVINNICCFFAIYSMLSP